MSVIVETHTKALTVWYLTEDHLQLQELIFRLHDSGLNDPQIANYLTQRKISSKRGKTNWEGKNVWAFRKKFEYRDSRLTHCENKSIIFTLITPLGTYEIKRT